MEAHSRFAFRISITVVILFNTIISVRNKSFRPVIEIAYFIFFIKCLYVCPKHFAPFSFFPSSVLLEQLLVSIKPLVSFDWLDFISVNLMFASVKINSQKSSYLELAFLF